MFLKVENKIGMRNIDSESEFKCVCHAVICFFNFKPPIYILQPVIGRGVGVVAQC